ncbi:MAG: glycosyltransferase family 4 protein [Candidatus Bathyarchaeia archaeon]
MRILWFNHRDPSHPEAGGAEVRIREIGKRLVKMGCIVKLVCERWDGSKTFEFLDGIEVVRVAGRYGLHLLAPFLLNGDRNFDIVVDDVAHAVPWFSSFFTRKPVVGQVHHLHESVLSLELPHYLAGFAALAERGLKYAYSVFVTVSESTRYRLIKKFCIPKERVFVVPNGVDLETYRPVCGKLSVPTVLWIGRVKRYKRVDHVLMAFKIVKEVLPDSRLIIVGEGDYLPFLKLLSKRLGLRDVVFAGRVSETVKVRLMSGAWVVVNASVVEGWGLTITEAAACGTPCVAYDVAGLRDSVKNGETGLLARDGDIKDLAEKITTVLEDDGLRKKLSKNALEYAKQFSWNKTTNEFLKIMEIIINDGI